MVSSLYRNFFLAQRVMQSLNCTPQSFPALPNAATHRLWGLWDRSLELFLLQLRGGSPVISFASFAEEQLAAFELFLVSDAARRRQKAEQLPMLLQALLSQQLRLRALRLLVAFIDLGGWACNQVLAAGLLPYLQKLLTQTTAPETHPLLVHIWAHILLADQTRPFDQLLQPNRQFLFFVSVLRNSVLAPNGPTTKEALFILTVIAEDNTATKHELVRCQLLDLLAVLLEETHQDVRAWVVLTLGKLWEGALDVKALAVERALPNALLDALVDHSPQVRAAALFALSTLFDEPRGDFGDLLAALLPFVLHAATDCCPHVRLLLLVFLHKAFTQLPALPETASQHAERLLADPDPDVVDAARGFFDCIAPPPSLTSLLIKRRKTRFDNIRKSAYDRQVAAFFPAPPPPASPRVHRHFTAVSTPSSPLPAKLARRLTVSREATRNGVPRALSLHPSRPCVALGFARRNALQVVSFTDRDDRYSTFEVPLQTEHPTSISALAQLGSDASPLLVAACRDASIRVVAQWDTPDASVVTSFVAFPEATNVPCSHIAALGADRLLCCNPSGANLVDLEAEQCSRHFIFPTPVTSANNFCGSQNMFLVGDEQGTVALFDTRLPDERCQVQTWKTETGSIVALGKALNAQMVSAAFVPQSAQNSGIALLDQRKEVWQAVSVPRLTCMASHPLAPVLVVGTTDQYVQVFDADNGQKLQDVRTADSFFGLTAPPISALAVDPFAFRVAVAMVDGSMVLFDDCV